MIATSGGEAVGRKANSTNVNTGALRPPPQQDQKGESMKPLSIKDEKENVIAIETEEIELDLEVLEDVIAPTVGPCFRK